MQSRFLKKLIFGGFYLALIFGFFFVVYIAVKPAPTCFDGKQNQEETGIDCGGPCEPCELKSLKPLKVSPVGVFVAPDDSVSALIEVKNLNTTFAASQFFYKLNFYDSAGAVIYFQNRPSFIYAGELKSIIETGIDIEASRIRRTTVELSGFTWKRAQEFSLPKTQIRDIQVEIQAGGRRAIISGVLVNQNTYPLPLTSINVIIENQLGIELGVSKTVLENVSAFEQRPFTIIFNDVNLSEVSRETIKIFVETRR